VTTRAARIGKSDAKKASAVDRRFSRVAGAFCDERLVTREEKPGFGSGALKVKGKIFAMIASKGEFVVKLPKARVDELVESGEGERFEPRPGRPMKEWVSVPEGHTSWITLAREAYDFVKGG
jgi:hypothetical protein